MAKKKSKKNLIPLDEERCREIEKVLADAMEHREQNRLAKMFQAQMANARGAGSDSNLRPRYITYAVILARR